ncbi:UDP-galactose transporter [Cylindrobasidium torrendii FP15055 ss-10]|uniref:UDP-galactose transporter homolog 1 n=1 Tax=Cylindrobasidium torrendii FP15055 ss-10 TaxID=1314674 RepID=A0A0D7BPK3_9AGAR|nr:UDP-galactose transporter [Cylindrobasidium torrendii FP15055 ss-10]
MSFARLLVCVGGVYVMFLAWAVAQERLSVPFVNIKDGSSAKFKSAIIISTAQSILSSLSAYVYILLRRKPSEPLAQSLGLLPPPLAVENGNSKPNGKHDHGKPSTRFSQNVLLARYLQCAAFITAAAPFGFAALAYVSYPTMVLAKSCKLVPVMIMNVLLYRRKFAPHKYLVVSMVTAGITVFMYMGDDKKASSHSSSSTSESPYGSLIGITYLLINLALDGAVNSTQDEIFVRHKVTGQQMMFWINVMSTGITVVLSLLPLPHIPVLHPSASGTSEMLQAIEFVRTHPDIIGPLALFAFTGALGQLFIFETLQHFGSLTLVTITLTRKMGTMLLSVFLYNHTLTSGQWLGAAIVFAGISVEAYVKRRDVHAKRVVQEKEKAKLKSL